MKQKTKLIITIHSTLENQIYDYAQNQGLSAGVCVDNLLTKLLPLYDQHPIKFLTTSHYTDLDNKVRFEQRVTNHNKIHLDELAIQNHIDKSTAFQIIFANFFGSLKE